LGPVELIYAVNTLEGSCRRYPTCRTPGTYTPKPVPSADLEIIDDKQPEDTVGRKSSGKSTIALCISSTTSGTHMSARKLYLVYDLPGSILNDSTYGYLLIFLPQPRSAKVLSPRNASPLLA
jgi:hypothetical protein